MLRYLEAFYRHRLLLLAPLILGLAASTAFVFLQPSTYEGSAKLWIDRGALGAPPTENVYQTPAQEQAAVIQELIKTRSFCIQVGQRGPLAADLQARGGGSGSLAKALGLVGVHQAKRLSQQDVDDLVFDTLNRHALVEAAGPQIVTVTFDYPDARVAGMTAGAIVDQFLDEALGRHRALVQAQVDFYTQQAAVASTDLATADQAVFQYIAGHPELGRPGAIPDAALVQYTRADDVARQRYTDILTKVDQASLDLAATKSSAPAGFRVIDPAEIPRLPVAPTKLILGAVAGGFGAGLLLTVLGLLALTLADASMHRPDDVERRLGLRVLAEVPQY